MTLVRYNPFRTFDSLARRMSDIMGSFERDKFIDNFNYSGFLPKVDIKEDEKNIFFKAEIPGINKEDIKITINDDKILRIQGVKKHEDKREHESFIRMERSFGEFTRSFVLPENVKEDEVKAEFKNGILEITLEKIEPAKPKEIEISIN